MAGTSKISSDASREVDVAIVGGGVAGAYAAWRLLSTPSLPPALEQLADSHHSRKLSVELFEYSNRIGGRLYSVPIPGIPSLPAELGGMRFLNSHKRVVSLVDRFRLQFRDLPVEDPYKRNLYFLRGRHFTAADWDRPGFVPPYELAPHEAMRSPGALLAEVALRHEGETRGLRETGFWNLMFREMSSEAYFLAREGVGYDTLVNNWNAEEAIPFLLADFPSDARYMALNKGFQSLPLTLIDHFQSAGGAVSKEHRLHRIDWDRGSRRIDLLFDTAAGPSKFVIPQPPAQGDALHVRAKHVILAMPRRAIELLHPDSFIFQSKSFQEALRSVLPQPAFKVFSAYREPWWTRERGITAGRSLTDLPIRQCYYWGTEENAPGGTRGNTNSVLMASYSDGSSVEFWAGLARHPERYSPPTAACPPGVGIPSFVADLSASSRLVEELQKQLRLLHGLNRLSPPMKGAGLLEPYVTLYRDWTQEPFGGGWHFWKIGIDSKTVMQFMREPFKDASAELQGAPLSVCGEAWSRQQGWVEGALETTDDVLENVFQLPPLN